MNGVLPGSSEKPAQDVRLRIAVGIATTGRPLILRRALERLREQTRVPDAIVVSAPSMADVSGIDTDQTNFRCIVGDRGLTMQRNAILRAVSDFGVVVFLDDDFVPCSRYLEVVEQTFRNAPDIVVSTGRVVADGILGPVLDLDDGLPGRHPNHRRRCAEDAR